MLNDLCLGQSLSSCFVFAFRLSSGWFFQMILRYKIWICISFYNLQIDLYSRSLESSCTHTNKFIKLEPTPLKSSNSKIHTHVFHVLQISFSLQISRSNTALTNKSIRQLQWIYRFVYDAFTWPQNPHRHHHDLSPTTHDLPNKK